MLNILYYFILYSSDEPERFKYFSEAFTKRLNQTPHTQFIEDKRIEELFLVNAIKDKTGHDFDKIILRGISLLKNKINEQEFQEAQNLSEKELKFFEKNLIQYPYEISHNTLINFYFWNAVANLNDKTKAQELLGLFLTYATLGQRNLLEAELSAKLYKKYDQILDPIKSITLNKYTITNMEKCDVFLNGVKLAQTTFVLPSLGKSMLSAICSNGFYAQDITQATEPNITLVPQIDKSLASMPPIAQFPINSIDRQKIKSVVLIYWSKKNHYIQTLVANPRNYADKHELILQLKTKEDLHLAGDKIFQFIFKNDKPLIQ